MLVGFKNSLSLNLVGRLEFPEPKKDISYPVAVFSHGFESGKDSPRGKPIAEEIRRVGIATFLIDFTGHGDSEGSLSQSTLQQQVDDLRSAIDFIEKQDFVDANAIGVTGASSGGLVALVESLSDRRVKALVLRGPRVDDMLVHAKEFTAPVLIISGEYDPLFRSVKAFYELLECPKQFSMIKGSGHLFETSEMLKEVAELTASWFLRYLRVEERENSL